MNRYTHLDAQVARLAFRGLALTLMKPTVALPGSAAISCPMALQSRLNITQLPNPKLCRLQLVCQATQTCSMPTSSA